MNLIPLGNRIIILPDPKKEVTKGGLIIPDKAQKEEGKGIIQAVSKDITTELQPGHHVMYSVGNCSPYEEAGTMYHVAPVDVISAIIND